MTVEEIDRLIAMLEPNADENTVLFVRDQFVNTIPRTSKDYVPPNRSEIPSVDRSEKCSSVEPYEEWSPNDPRNW